MVHKINFHRLKDRALTWWERVLENKGRKGKIVLKYGLKKRNLKD